MIIGDIFSGIGGFSLAARWLGWQTAFFAELEEYPSRVLARHWPGVPNLGDLRKVDWSTVPPVDVLCGGFPCQPASVAGKRKGADDERWLWPEYARAIRALRPRGVLAENVPGLLSVRGGDTFGEVLRDLANLGYDASWHVLSAADVGAPHLRKRAWILATPSPFPDALELGLRDLRQRLREQRLFSRSAVTLDDGAQEPMADADGAGQEHDREGDEGSERISRRNTARDSRRAVSDPDSLEDGRLHEGRQDGDAPALAAGSGEGTHRPRDGRDPGWWSTEPDVGRVVNGLPARVDRLAGLGNAIVPLCAYYHFQLFERWLGRHS